MALWLFSTSPTLCCREIQVSTKITVLPSWTLSETPDLENFASAYRNVLSTSLDQGGRSQRDKLDSHWSTKLIIPSSSDARPLSFITGDRQPLSTARFCCAGQLATADTCLFSLTALAGKVMQSAVYVHQFHSDFRAAWSLMLIFARAWITTRSRWRLIVNGIEMRPVWPRLAQFVF